MSQISFINAYSINPYEDMEMKKRYIRHKNKIQQISKKSSNFNDIQIQQQRIISAIHKSKQIARKFQMQEFNLRRESENKRMINLLSRFQGKKSTEQPISNSIKQSREKTIKKFQMQLQDKNRNQHLQQYIVNKRQYRKKIKKQINQYQKLKNHMQKFKNIVSAKHSRLSSREANAFSSNKRVNIQSSLLRQGRTEPAQLNKSHSLPPLHLIA